MGIELRKYGVSTTVRFPLVKASSQNFAVSGDYTHASGDVKISKDGGAAATATNSPSAVTMGNGAYWTLTLTATEMEAAEIIVTIIDAATKAVEDQMVKIHTHGHASAMIVADLSAANLAANVTQFGGSNGTFASGRPEVNTTHIAGSSVSTSSAQIGVNVVNFGGSAGTFASGRPEVNASHWGGTAVASAVVQANAAQISGDSVAADNLEAMLDGTGGVTLTTAITGNITGNLSGAVGSVTGNVGGNVSGSVGSISGVSFPSNFASLGINASGHVSRVTLCDTITTYTGNTPQTGDSYARLGAPVGASIAADIATRLATSGYTAPLDAAGVRAAVGLASANLDTQLDTLPTASETAAQVAAIDIDGKTLQAAFRIVCAAAAGLASGAGTSSETYKGLDQSTTRLVVVADASGNRTSVTYS